MAERPARTWLVAAPLAAAAIGALAFTLWILAGASAELDGVMRWVYDLSIVSAGVACVARAADRRELRGAWLAFGVGLWCWAAGDIYWVQSLEPLPEIPYPSWADAGYILSLPFFFVGTGLLIRQRVGRFTADRWLDGAIAALAAASLAVAFLAPALVGLTNGDPATVLVNLSYPLGDVIVLGFILAALVLSGIRGAGAILVVGAGLVIWCAGDIYYLWATGTDTYAGGLSDCLWPAGAVLIAAGALPVFRVQPGGAAERRSPLLPPTVSALVVTGILIWDHFDRLTEASVWLAAATVLAAIARLTLSFRENGRLLDELHGEAVTDALTGLGNRRKLIQDLERAYLTDADGDQGSLFVLFDLDGFKSYNDNFGHPAGDALLERLGAKLAATVGEKGVAYRLGGDEFCILVSTGDVSTIDQVEEARDALSEKGEGFLIGASGGWLTLPGEADGASDALLMADQRMYEEKNRRSTRAMQQTHDLLMRILHEREPALGAHSDGVSEMAVALGGKAKLDSEELDQVARAAQLHDIGKIAIPDEILQKPAALDDVEWKLMRRHTLIGERILGASLAMTPVGRLVRSSHERWDGGGYPDGLAGADIPLGSRIIFISDSFDAMTAERPYSPAMPAAEAVAELRRCAGTQFDPGLVDLFLRVLEEQEPGGRNGLRAEVSTASAERRRFRGEGVRSPSSAGQLPT